MYLAFLSPVVIAFLIAYLYPVLRTVQMSFFEVSDTIITGVSANS